jgi:Cdc6-like AAA superfamily ATPase
MSSVRFTLNAAEKAAVPACACGAAPGYPPKYRYWSSVKARHLESPRALARTIPLAQPKGELAELLTVHYPQQHLSQMVLSPSAEQKIARVIKEQRNHEKLSGHGLEPRRKLLLVGPPGTGKTLRLVRKTCE